MADRPALPSSTEVERTKPSPFKPNAKPFLGKSLDFVNLAPQSEPEPEVELGADLAGQPKILFAAGRGKT
jgi:hypothetical protein